MQVNNMQQSEINPAQKKKMTGSVIQESVSRKKKIGIYLFLIFHVAILNAPPLLADGLDSISSGSLATSIGKIIKWIAGFTALIFGAFGFIQSGIAYTNGDAGTAMTKFKNTSIGILIILACWAMAKYVVRFVA